MGGGYQSTTVAVASISTRETQAQAHNPTKTDAAQDQDQEQALRRPLQRRIEEGISGNANANVNLPKCEPLSLTVPLDVPPEIHSSPQIVIAHRGASSHLPEHSLEGYRLALELGADYIEPDLVATADHHLVAMHSLDLTATTNVVEVFGASKNKTASNYIRENTKTGTEIETTGYWVYDFTLEELKQLRLKQRLGGPENNARSKAFDGLFQIPTLTEILELLNDWNENVQPLWYHDNNNNNNHQPHRYPPPPRGLYAELKDFPWLLKDADINLIDLFFDHIEKEKSVWEMALLRHMCDTKKLREHQYRLPPLVMQSFEVEVLKNFTKRWEEIANHKINHKSIGGGSIRDHENDSNSTKHNTPVLTFEVPLDSSGDGDGDVTSQKSAHIPLPTPPTILLVTHDKCLEENFWFEMEHSYRSVITGIGPDKMCFFQADETDVNATPQGQDQSQSQKVIRYTYQPTVMERAKELGWIVHPWTERPEETFFATTNDHDRRRKNQAKRPASLVPFENVLEELLFLKCTVGVHGVFSESVDVAVRAMGMACPGTKTKGGIGHSHSPSGSGGSPFDKSEIPLGPVIGFSFCSGILAALMIWKYCGGGGGSGNDAAGNAPNQPPQTRRAPRILGRRQSNLPPHLAVPTGPDDDYDDADVPVALDDTDREIL